MAIAVSADLLRFIGIADTPTQAQDVYVQNMTQRPLRVRVAQPRTSNFAVAFDNAQTIAPGMRQKATVTFHADQVEKEYLDEIAFVAEAGRVPVKLEALSRFADLRVPSQQLDAGVFCTGETRALSLPVHNQGADAAEVHIEYQQLQGYPVDLAIHPANVVIDGGATAEVAVRLRCPDPGTFHFLLKVTDGDRNTITIQLIATAVVPQLLVTDETGAQLTDDLVFKTLFFDKQQRVLYLSNPTPFDIDFSLALQVQECNQQLPKDVSHFVVEPASGTTRPDETVQVTVTFQPALELKKVDQINKFMEGFSARDAESSTGGQAATVTQAHNYDVDVFVQLFVNYDYKSIKDSVAVNLVGFARRPLFLFDRTRLNFTEALEVQSLAVKNHCDEVVRVEARFPVYVQLKDRAGKRDCHMVFQPREQKIITLIFNPKAMLKLNDYAFFQFGNRYFCANIPVVTNFRQPRAQVAAKIDSRNRTIKPPDKLSNTNVLNQTKVDGEATNAAHQTYNQLKYSKVLSDKNLNYNTRYLNRANDRQNEHVADTLVSAYNDGLDLGMADTAYDGGDSAFSMAQPLERRRRDYTEQQLDDMEEYTEAAVKAKERPGLRNTLVPASKNYFRDTFDAPLFNKVESECKQRLQNRQLQLVSMGTLELDCGEVTVDTEVQRYFKIANDLGQYIKVELRVVEPEEGDAPEEGVQLRVQPVQYLPPSCYTSFQVHATFLTVTPGLSRKVSVLINDVAEHQLTVRAVVTRPKLHFNCKTYTLSGCQEALATLVGKLRQQASQNQLTADQDAQLAAQLAHEAVYFELNGQNAFQPQITHKIEISNIGTSSADCIFELLAADEPPGAEPPAGGQRAEAEDFLTLSCGEQTLQVNDYGALKLSWRPSQQEVAARVLAVRFQQGYEPYYVPVVCRLTAGRGRVLERALDCGVFTVRRQVAASFSIQNVDERRPLYYEVLLEEAATLGLRLAAENGRGEVAAGQAQAVYLTLEASHTGPFSFRLPVRIIGGERLCVAVKGFVEAPRILVSQRGVNDLSGAIGNSSANVQRSASNASQAIEQLKETRAVAQNINSAQQEVFSYDCQRISLAADLIAHAQHIQRLYISNLSRVAADVFVDVRHVRAFEILESEADDGVYARFISFQVLQEMFNVYHKEAVVAQKEQRRQNKLFGGIQKQKTAQGAVEPTSGTSEADQFQLRLNVPIFKNATDSDYREYTNVMMADGNLNALYGEQMVRQDGPGAGEWPATARLLHVQIQPGKSYQLNLQIIEPNGGLDVANIVTFYCLGNTYDFDKMNTDPETLDKNQLVIQYHTINSSIQLSANKLTFGIKVADINFKANKVEYPLGCKELHYRLLEQNYPCKYMEHAANNGLFSQDLCIANQLSQKVRFVAEVCDINEAMVSDTFYKLSHPIGVINGYESLQLRVYYSPTDVGPHNFILRFYYTDDAGLKDEQFFVGRNYRSFQKIQILLQGVAVHKSLSFSCHELILPNTAIGVPTKASFMIYNNGYKNNTPLQVFFPPELSKCILMVQFPWGNVINHMIKVLPVVITFISDTQMSFKSQMSVLDSNNIPYNINVSGNCYESAFCLYSYLECNCDRLEAPDSPCSDVNYAIVKEAAEPRIPTVQELTVENGRRYGVSGPTLQALQSIKAQPVADLSDYARALKLDQMVQLTGYRIAESATFAVTEPMQKRGGTSRGKTQTGVPGAAGGRRCKQLAEALSGGMFVSAEHGRYSGAVERLKFCWQYQFKRQPKSEAPLSVYLPYIPDQLSPEADASVRPRLQLVLTLLERTIGLQVPISNVFGYCTGVQNRQSGFLLQIQQLYKQNFRFQPKDVQNITTVDYQRCEFFRLAFDSMLACLKIKGALLNNVVTPLLLDRANFLLFARRLIQKEAEVCFTKPGEETTSTTSVNSQYLVSQQQVQTLLELLGRLHQLYHQTCWCSVFFEMARIYVINYAADEKQYSALLQKHKTFIQSDGQQFNMLKTVVGRLSKQDVAQFVGMVQGNFQIKAPNPDQVLLNLVNYFTNFQLFKLNESAKLAICTNFRQLMSGVQVGCLVISFIYSLNIASRIEDVLSIAQKIMEARQQRTDVSGRPQHTSLMQCCNAQHGEEGTSEKLLNQLDAARQALWKDIAQLVRTQFSVSIDERMFYGQRGVASQSSANPHSQAIQLLVAFLYQALPSYLPGKAIRVQVTLGETLEQRVELTGSARGELRYTCAVLHCDEVPSCNVELNTRQVFLEAGRTQTVSCKISAQFIKRCCFVLQFTPTYDGARLGMPQANYVAVEAVVVGRKELQQLRVEGRCGQATRLSVQVENGTPLDARYTVQLTETFYAVDPARPVGNPAPAKSPPAFRADRTLSVSSHSSGGLGLTFTPAYPGLYLLSLELSDEHAGTMTVEVRGFALLPEPLRTLRFAAPSSEARTFDIAFSDIGLQPKECEAALRYALVPVDGAIPLQVRLTRDIFRVQYSPRGKQADAVHRHKLILLLDGATKVYQVFLQLIKKQDLVKLDFEAPARTSMSQKITITNNDETEQQYAVVLQHQGDATSAFVFNDSPLTEQRVTVARKSSETFMIRFEPAWICEQTATLSVKYLECGITIADYALHGVGGKPLPSGTIELAGRVVDTIEAGHTVRNDSKQELALRLSLEDDQKIFSLPDSLLTIKPGQAAECRISAHTFLSGKYKTRLYITYPDDTYYVYDVRLTASSRESSGKLTTNCPVGGEAELTMEVQNLLDDGYVDFKVNMQGLPEHFITIPQIITVAPRETQSCKLLFNPSAMGEWIGKVSFSSEKLGEYWYEVRLVCDEIAAVEETFQASIGTGSDKVLSVTNVLQEMSLTYTVELSNREAFAVAPSSSFTLKPQSSMGLKVVYRPTQVSRPEVCIMDIVGRDTQDIVQHQMKYRLVGRGTVQQTTPTVRLYALLNNAVSGQLTFTNPFLSRASVRFEHDSVPEFQFQYQNGQLLDPQQQIPIKYLFLTQTLCEVSCSLRVYVNPSFDVEGSEEFPFTYQFTGVGEYVSKAPIAFLECQCRQTDIKTVELPSDVIIENVDDCKLDIECADSGAAHDQFNDLNGLVRRSLHVSWDDDNMLRCQFSPLKPMGCNVTLVIVKGHGGRYRLTLSLRAMPPPPEGSIVVELPNGTTPGQHTFTHCNILNVYSEFRAYFTPGSSERLSVTPERGILEPSQQTGISTVQTGKSTEFTIRCDVGTTNARGQLVIETKDIIFLWDVTSGFKKYIPPTGKGKVGGRR